MTRSLGDIRMKKFGVISEPSSMTELPLGDPDYARITRINHSTDAFFRVCKYLTKFRIPKILSSNCGYPKKVSAF